MTTAEKLTTIAKNREKLYEAGKKAEYDENWDQHQWSGKKSNYNYSFAGTWWTDDTFLPKYNMIVTSANNMFCNSNITDLKACLDRAGVILDLSKANPAGYLFNGMVNLTTLPEINLSGATAGSYRLDNIFNGDKNLVYIEKFIVRNDGLNTFNNVFNNCESLYYLRMEGVVGNDIDLKSCPLNRESFMGEEITGEKYNALSETVRNNNVYIKDGKYYYGGVITALKSDSSGKTASFKQTAKEKAFTAEEWAALIATKPNWTFTLA